VALVLAVGSLCFPPLLVAALVLAVVSLARGNQPAFAARRGLAVAALVVSAVAVPLWGVVAAVAIPAFVRAQARARQLDCTAQLQLALEAERRFFADHGRYSVHPAEVGFGAEANTRSLLRFDNIGPLATAGQLPPADAVGFAPRADRTSTTVEALDEGLGIEVRQHLGIHGACPDCSIGLACAGNLDLDPALDVWSISSAERSAPGGPTVPAGAPFQHLDDLTDQAHALPARGWQAPGSLAARPQAPADAGPPSEDRDPHAWRTYSFDGKTGLEEAPAGDRCLLTCTLADGSRAWESVRPCQATRGERRFLAPDCERLVVLVPAPDRGKAWAATEVMRVYQRGELAYAVMGAAVMNEKAMRTSPTWLQGCFGAPGEEPRYAADGRAVEYTTLEGKPGRVSLVAEQAKPASRSEGKKRAKPPKSTKPR
jgi:type IV pilus assembly protein PilA